MQESRKLVLSDTTNDGQAVVYVMSRDQRTQDNHALLFAARHAQELGAPLYVLFVLRAISPRAREHYHFMLEGLEEVAASLSEKNIRFVLREGDTQETIATFIQEISAAAVYFDFHPSAGRRALAKTIANAFDGYVAVVDTHNIIPVWTASDKQEYAAHTFRRKVHKFFEHYAKAAPELEKQKSLAQAVDSLSFADARTWIDDTIPATGITIEAKPGEKAALKHLQTFIETGLATYADGRNDPSNDQQSGLSPYLHYGQLSSLRVVMDVIAHLDIRPFLFEEPRMPTGSSGNNEINGMNALFEELVVRKELSDNFVLHAENPKDFSGLADWAKKTLAKHADDPRDFLYTQDQWEEAKTHDDAWNASQIQLMKTGKLHGYLRMYWAKKLLEWSESPEEALRIGIYLNDKYSIDGGDPNGYVGLLWSIGGLHDRPWTERPVFGQIRYMNAAGLKRKFDLQKYIDTWRP